MEKQLANQKNIDKLVEYIKELYDIKIWESLFCPYFININLKDIGLTIDTSKSYQFELKEDVLTFINYSEGEESISLKDYRKEVK